MLLLFLPNDHLLIWLPAPPEPPRRLLARIRAGDWPLPPAITERFEVPDGLVLHAHSAVGTLVVRPDYPLVEKMPGAPLRLTDDQLHVMRLLESGLSGRQIARALGRSPRWVRYQLEAIRRACLPPARSPVSRRHPRHSGSS